MENYLIQWSGQNSIKVCRLYTPICCCQRDATSHPGGWPVNHVRGLRPENMPEPFSLIASLEGVDL
jgi:hypothetical protein